MSKIGFIDIAKDSRLYVIEKRAGTLECMDVLPVSCTGDYDISVSGIKHDIGEFYLSIPLSLLSFRILELPFAEREKVLGVLPFELQGLILKGTEDVVIDGIILGSNNGKSRVLAVYAEKALLGKIMGKLQVFNIDPRTVTSIELRHALREFDPERLLSPGEIKQEERINVAIEEINSPSIDLRKGELSYTRDAKKTERSLRLTATLAIAALVLLALLLAVRIVSVRNETSVKQSEISKIYSAAFPDDKQKLPNLYQLRARMKELKDKEEALIGISPLNLLFKLSNIERGGVTFSEIVMDKDRIALKGDAASLGDLQKIKDSLSQILKDVNIADSKTSAQGRIIFTITAKEIRT